jgi:hypothetical protein
MPYEMAWDEVAALFEALASVASHIAADSDDV